MKKTYYVSVLGNDKYDGITEIKAFASLGRALYSLNTGDTILMMNGTYYTGGMVFNKNGSDSNWTTIKAYPGHFPKIITVGDGINIFSSSYVQIDGLDIQGCKDGITLDYALREQTNLNNPLTNSNGIKVGTWKDSFGNGGTNPHHILITGNKISSFPGCGISCMDADYIGIDRNSISGNGWYSPYGCQGVSILRAFNYDNNAIDYKLVITNNTVFDNQSLIPWYGAGKITEGHGIMLDTLRKCANGLSYAGRSLIANNVCYHQGGAGIQIFESDNADVLNNTCFENGNVLTSCGEILANYCSSVKISQNILVAKTGQYYAGVRYADSVTFSGNCIYNSGAMNSLNNTNLVIGANLSVDPLFTNSNLRDFTLQPNSPAYRIVATSQVALGFTGN